MATTQANRPSNPFATLPRSVQLVVLKADMETVRSTRGPLRRQGPFIRAHFLNRLLDAKAARA